VIAGSTTGQASQDRVRSYYRQEVEALDRELNSLWESLSEDTRVVFCADRGELLGEDGLWGHIGTFRVEVIQVPLGGINIEEPGELVSLIDVPSLLLSAEHHQGSLDREIAYATDGREWASTDGHEIAIPDGVFDLADSTEAENTRLKRARSAFDVKTSALDEADEEDLKYLGYI